MINVVMLKNNGFKNNDLVINKMHFHALSFEYLFVYELCANVHYFLDSPYINVYKSMFILYELFKCLVDDNMFLKYLMLTQIHTSIILRQTGHIFDKKIKDSDSFKILHLLKFSGLFHN